jgi:hypothetical protein
MSLDLAALYPSLLLYNRTMSASHCSVTVASVCAFAVNARSPTTPRRDFRIVRKDITLSYIL